jgi:LytS/YehU family sensor histidine kinase
MCLAALYLCRAMPLQHTAPGKLVPTLLLASLASSFVWIAGGRGVAAVAAGAGFLPGLEVRFDARAPYLFGIGALLFLLSIAMHYLLIAFDAARTAERHALELQVLARESELKALRAQIQPHFLFNSLNSISSLALNNPAGARAMTLRLAEYFRSTLRNAQQHFIPLGEELRLAEHFLSIEQTRFGQRLSYEMCIERGCESVPVPSLILQPIVENAVGHGIAHLLEGGAITLAASIRGGVLSIRVLNPCDRDRVRAGNAGLGLENIRRRLLALYGSAARCAIQETPDQFLVELVLPVVPQENTPTFGGGTS